MRIHQLIIGASSRDAITNMARTLRESLPSEQRGNIYSYFPPEPSAADFVIHHCPSDRGSEDDLIVYHSSFGLYGVTKWLLNRREKLVISYHNATPATYYERYDPDFALGLSWARRELEIIRPKVIGSIADSQFNANELHDMGYSDARVIPAGLKPTRLRATSIDVSFLSQLQDHFPDGFLLVVSQVLPHKRMETALEIVHLLRTVHRMNIGLVIAGPQRNPKYSAVLNEVRARLSEAHVLFTGEITEEQLATLYRHCRCFLSTSDHEGLAIPPLEAMAEGAPTVVRGAGAVPETVQNASVVVPPQLGVVTFTEAVHHVLVNDRLRAELRSRGYRRVAEVEAENPGEQFRQLIEDMSA